MDSSDGDSSCADTRMDLDGNVGPTAALNQAWGLGTGFGQRSSTCPGAKEANAGLLSGSSGSNADAALELECWTDVASPPCKSRPSRFANAAGAPASPYKPAQLMRLLGQSKPPLPVQLVQRSNSLPDMLAVLRPAAAAEGAAAGGAAAPDSPDAAPVGAGHPDPGSCPPCLRPPCAPALLPHPDADPYGQRGADPMEVHVAGQGLGLGEGPLQPLGLSAHVSLPAVAGGPGAAPPGGASAEAVLGAGAWGPWPASPARRQPSQPASGGPPTPARSPPAWHQPAAGGPCTLRGCSAGESPHPCTTTVTTATASLSPLLPGWADAAPAAASSAPLELSDGLPCLRPIKVARVQSQPGPQPGGRPWGRGPAGGGGPGGRRVRGGWGGGAGGGGAGCMDTSEDSEATDTDHELDTDTDTASESGGSAAHEAAAGAAAAAAAAEGGEPLQQCAQRLRVRSPPAWYGGSAGAAGGGARAAGCGSGGASPLARTLPLPLLLKASFDIGNLLLAPPGSPSSPPRASRAPPLGHPAHPHLHAPCEGAVAAGGGSVGRGGAGAGGLLGAALTSPPGSPSHQGGGGAPGAAGLGVGVRSPSPRALRQRSVGLTRKRLMEVPVA